LGCIQEKVAESQDRALELFATKIVDITLHFDFNQCASPFDARTPPPMNQEEMSEPPMTQHVAIQSLSPIYKNQDEAFGEGE
jgi:hypothetical protein